MKYMLLVLGLMLGSNTWLVAQANLSVQGSIQNSSGIALADGKYSLTFRLYESETGGTAVWSETQPALDVAGGLYSATLGLISPLTASFDKPYYLGVTVNNSPELLPRARLSSSPYALSLIGQSNIFPSTGTVGIGTKSPDSGAQLHVKNSNGTGKVTVEGTDGAEIVFKKENDTATISYDGDKINISNFNLVFDEGIKLPVNKSVRYNGDADWRLVDTDDFETGTEGWICHTRWDGTTTATFERFTPNTPFSKGWILRPTHGGAAVLKKELDLTGIPHTMVKVVFTYHFFDDWDYYKNVPDDTDFAYGAFATQANPYVSPGQSNGFFQIGWRRPAVTDFNNYFGGIGYTTFASVAGDHNVRASMAAQTSRDKFWIFFGSNLDQPANNESFGISNIEIWVR
jgi:hypothetical protein